MIQKNARSAWARRVLGTCAIAGAAAALAAAPALATQPGTVSGAFVEDGHKVTICHRTGAATNPYVVITIDVAAINDIRPGNHDHHDQVGNGPVGDVIPPVPGFTSGKNWTGNWAPGDDVTADLCVGGVTPPPVS